MPTNRPTDALRGVLLALFLLPAVAVAQAPTVQLAPPLLLQQFDVTAGTMQSLAVPPLHPPTAQVAVSLAGAVVVLDLRQHEVRSPDYQLLESGPQGLVSVAVPECVTYRGAVVGDPESAVAATIDQGSLTAYVVRGDGMRWMVQPVAEVLPGAAPALHLVYRSTDSAPLPGVCGVTAQTQPVGPAVGGEDGVSGTQIAIEADFPFYQLNGSSTLATQNDILTVVNALDLIYRRDTGIGWIVSIVFVRAFPDQYTSTNSSTLLDQFRIGSSSIGNPIGATVRDTAHLFTGRQLDSNIIGLAYVGSICSSAYGYGLSESLYTLNLSYRTSLTAHELGHNYNAGHCDAVSPCNIMCSINGGCGSVTSFGPSEQSAIIAFRNSRTCLSYLATPPQITTMTPATVKSWRPGNLAFGGTGFVGVNRVDLGATAATTGITVTNYTAMTLAAPAGLPIGQVPVTATNSDGTSNTMMLTVTAANPCEQSIPSTVNGGTAAVWQMGGWPFDYAFTLLSLSPTTVVIPGGTALAGGSILWSGPLDDRGMATFSVPVPANVLNGLQFYTQMLDLNLTTLALRSSSIVHATTIVN